MIREDGIFFLRFFPGIFSPATMLRSTARIAGLSSVPLFALGFREHSRMQPPPSDRPVVEVLSTPLYSDWTRWYRFFRPLGFTLTPDPETAHRAAIIAGRVIGEFYVITERLSRVSRCLTIGLANFVFGRSETRGSNFSSPSRLATNVGGVDLVSPIGLAAGFDKNGKLIDFFLHNSFQIASAELGSVSLHPWAGNPRPRLFRVPSLRAIINRMGLNNQGAETVANRLSESDLIRRKKTTKIGINITKTPNPEIENEFAIDDFCFCFDFMKRIDNLAWITLNISCPNTAEGKTFEDPVALQSLLSRLHERSDENCPPIFLKVAPVPATGDWIDQATNTIEIAKKFNVAAMVVANTVPDRVGLESDEPVLSQRGGLSGPPIFERSHPLVKLAHNAGMSVIAVGGIGSGKDAFEMIRKGASAVQIYTSMVYDGPGVFADITNGLERELLINGFDDLTEAIGIDAMKLV
jgi:dihydroorotate dehydrogenase